jgi:CubicO group peptidase (beta-lactamase class C family)
MKLDAVLRSIGGGDHLRQELELACETSSILGAALTVVGEDRCYSDAYGHDANGHAFRPTTRQEVGCAVKLPIATMLAPLMCDFEIPLDAEIRQCLGLSSQRAKRFLGQTSIRHLLSAVDGIGYRAFSRTPVAESGFIDLTKLLEIVYSDERTCDPGEYLTPSHTGYALLAALLEQCCEEPLASTIERSLFRYLRETRTPNDTASAGSIADAVCPASGTGLRLSVAEWGEFLRFHMDPGAFGIPFFAHLSSLSQLLERQVTAPGWTGGLTANALGWNIFPGGWVGRNGLSAKHTVIIRLHPSRKLGFVFLCAGSVPITYAALVRLIGEALPEFNVQNGPRLLTREEQAEVSNSRYVGRFRSGSRNVVISEAADNQLEASLSEVERGRARIELTKILAPATQNIFFVRPPNLGIWFLQYVARDDSSVLWDGTTAWRCVS